MSARSLYKGEKLGKRPPCAICVGAGQGPRELHHLPYGISVWLCVAHRDEAFLTRRAGRDLVASLGAVFAGAGCLTRRRSLALEAELRRVQEAHRARGRPGSYSWPALRREAERHFAAGDAPGRVIAELRRRGPREAERVPSARTMRHWFAERRWEAGGPVGAGERAPRRPRAS